MRTLMICEKSSQEKNWRAALGAGSTVTVLSAQGHLIRLEEPKEDNPAYADWTDVVLRPSRGRYATRVDTKGAGHRKVGPIEAALRTADEVIIATDCDREGQLIGQELLEHFGFRGAVRRAMFSAEDRKSLLASLAAARDNADHRSLYDAAVARQQGDQIFNLSATRIATISLRPDDSRDVYGMGRVKTPTLGIVCRLEKEIRGFKPVTFFDVSMTVEARGLVAVLGHAPRGEARIEDRARADAVLAAARGWSGPLAVTAESKRRAPPRPYDLTTLQVKAGAWGWRPERTEEVAQALYDTHKVTTYPRTECRYLPENAIPDAAVLLAGLRTVPAFSGYALAAPVIRTGKGGVYCDAELSGKGISHHAIIPNVNAPAAAFAKAHAALDADERRLFELIARGFLAAIGEDQLYDQTTIAAQVAVPGGDPATATFRVVGSVTTYAGWRAAYPDGDDGDDEDEGAGEGTGALPPFVDGEAARARDASAKQQVTKPPSRLTPATLIREMKNPAKHVADAAERKRLEDCKGIGTAATRKDVLPGLLRQRMVEIVAGKVVPTDAALDLYDIVHAAAPELFDVGATARMEMRLDDVQAGRATADEVISEFASRADRIRDSLVEAGRNRKVTGATVADRSQVKGARKSTAKGGVTAPPRGAQPTSASPQPPLPAGATRLRFPFDRNGEAKGLGARWNAREAVWYAPQGTDLAPFETRGWVAASKSGTPPKARAG